MRIPRLTTRHWIIAVALLALWLSLFVESHRLQARSREHRARSAQARLEAGRGLPRGRNRPTPLSDWHFRKARQYYEQADFLEAVCVTMPIVVAAGAIIAPLVLTLRKQGKVSLRAAAAKEGTSQTA